MERRLQILLAAPYPELKDVAIEVASEFPEVELEVFIGNLEHATEHIRTSPRDHYDILMSRGRTSQLLQENFNIPVVDIGISAYDVLRTIKLAEICDRRFAIVAFSSIAKAGKVLQDILCYTDLEVLEANTHEETIATLTYLKNKGTDLVISGVSTAELAQQMGMRGLLVTSSADDVRQAFHQAIRLSRHLQQASDKIQLLYTALNRQNEAVALLNADGSTYYMNAAFRTMSSQEVNDFLSSPKAAVKEGGNLHCMQSFGEYLYDVHGEVIVQGNHALRLYRFFRIGSACSSRCIEVESEDTVRKRSCFLFLGSEYIRPIIFKMDVACKSAVPTMITGAIGTEKGSAARYIHRNSANCNEPFIRICCDSLTEKIWTSSVNSIQSPFYLNGCTVFFENIHALTPALQAAVDSFLDDAAFATRNRLIASFAGDINEAVTRGQFSRSLYKKLCGTIIHMPSLNERTDDIPGLAGLYVARFNNLLCKEVAGFEPRALELLKEARWELNLDQFQQVIRQLVETCTSYYITSDNVRELLQTGNFDNGARGIDLTKPLEEIESAIVSRVLQEENMNQTAAAKRLGISRSTLWRKLRDCS